MRTLFVTFAICVTLLVPLMLVVRHFACDETERLRRALREEQESWNRMKRIMEQDIQYMHDAGLDGIKRNKHQ